MEARAEPAFVPATHGQIKDASALILLLGILEGVGKLLRYWASQILLSIGAETSDLWQGRQRTSVHHRSYRAWSLSDIIAGMKSSTHHQNLRIQPFKG